MPWALAPTGGRVKGRAVWASPKWHDKMPDMAEIPITDAQIKAVVAAFYAAVRDDPSLGPVFAAHVTDWPAHEAVVVSFWRKAMGRGGSYDGRPAEAHARAGNVRPGMFDIWLGLFDATLHAHLTPAQAAEWSALAHRIGAPLRAAVSGATRRGQVPDLGPIKGTGRG